MEKLIIINLIPFLLSFGLGMYVILHMRMTSYNVKRFVRQDGDGGTNGLEIGGFALFPVLLISFCTTVALPNLLEYTLLRREVEPSTMRILQLLVGSAVLYIMGLKDDINGTGLRVKFLAILCASMMFPATGLWINDLNGLFGLYAIPAWVGMPVTVLVCMYITLAISIIDSTEGLTAGVSAIIITLYLLFSIKGHFTLGTIITSATLGVVLAFSTIKFFNKHWRKTLMGSCGTFVIGHILCYLVIGLSRQGGGHMPEGMFMICFGIILVPVLDVIRVMKSRVQEERGLLTLDRNQIQHQLLRTGMRTALIPPTIGLTIIFFTAFNTVWVVSHLNLTLLLLVDIVLWLGLQLVLGWGIRRYEAKYHKAAWNKVYGREAWESDIPHEKLQRKMENYGTMGLPTHMVNNAPMEFIPDGMNGLERGTKRLFDLLVSVTAMVLFSPLYGMCWVMIKLDDGGPALFQQERIGRFGRPFHIYKFRSMRLDAEKNGPALSHARGEEDPRLTRVGRFLRAHHLDELPQLWNVLVGDMAFIGYRPERKYYIDQIMREDPRYAFLYQIRPGVTSYATLYNGYTDTMEKMLRRLELDLYYLGHRSWWFDCKVLFLTFTNIIFGKKF